MISAPMETLKRARKLRAEMTLPEVMLWKALRTRPGGFKFRRQHPAGPFVLDFYCVAARLVIEVDGWGHDSADAQKRDQARSAFLRSQGLATLRVPAKVVLEDIERAVLRIEQVCRERVQPAE